MIYISNQNELNNETASNSKQYLLRVVYDSEDKNVHKLLEGIFGPDQMLDVKNGKIAKVNSALTPSERDSFFSMVSKVIDKIEAKGEEQKNIVEDSKVDFKVDTNNDKKINKELDSEVENNIVEQKAEDIVQYDNKNSRKVSAQKLIEEFSNFLNSIS